MDHHALAREFLAAYKTGAAIPLPPSARGENFTLDDAYAAEAEFRLLRIAEGHTPVGRKVGYANKAMWRVLKLDTLVWASIYDDTVLFTGDHARLSLANCASPKIEPEIVFKLKGTGGFESVEWMALGFEIIDCPFPEWQFTPADFVAAFGLHKNLVVGKPYAPASADQLATFKVKLFRNDELVDEGSSRNSLRSPALCLNELARVAHLSADEIVSTGTLTSAQPIVNGEQWRFEVDGLATGPLTLRVTAPLTSP